MSDSVNWAKVKRTAVKVVAPSQLNAEQKNPTEILDSTML
jgi:hypothetical protein